MKTYSIFIKKEKAFPLNESIFVKEGFSWKAAIFTFFWALYHRIWGYAALLLIVFFGIGILEYKAYIDDRVALAFQVFFMLAVGVYATSWYIKTLHSKGYVLCDIINETNLDNAKLRFFRRHAKVQNNKKVK